MCRYLLRIGSAGIIAALLAMAASADPQTFNNQSRWYGNSVGGGLCNDIENGYFCRDITAWENYDVRGMFESVEAAISSSRFQYDPNDGSWSSASRYLRCPVDRKAIAALPNRVSLEATLDPAAFGCYSYGYIDSWDPVNGYQSVPWPYPGPMTVTGEWADPFSYGQSIINQMGTYYDGWSNTDNTIAQHCNQRWGDAMRSGGFSIGNRSYEFQGPAGPAWSNYSVNSCNDRNTQR